MPLRVRSLVGLLPLFAVEMLEQDTINRLPGFKKRLKWFVKNRYDLAQNISYREAAHRGRQLRAAAARHPDARAAACAC